jgi:ferrous iron transport protein A
MPNQTPTRIAQPARALASLAVGQRGRIVAISRNDQELALKLREIGFSEGDEVELMTRGPFGGQPLAVRLNRTLIAMRGPEADAIQVEIVHD